MSRSRWLGKIGRISRNMKILHILGGTPTAGGLALLNISVRVLNASLCPFHSLSSRFDGYGFCSE